MDIGFSTFFLNRTNRSGIIDKAGPIGGLNQDGDYSIDCRFNKTKLIDQIKKIAENREKIALYNMEALDLICLLYTSDAADDMQCVDLGGRRIIKKKKNFFQAEDGIRD